MPGDARFSAAASTLLHDGPARHEQVQCGIVAARFSRAPPAVVEGAAGYPRSSAGKHVRVPQLLGPWDLVRRAHVEGRRASSPALALGQMALVRGLRQRGATQPLG
jgi:hypothetical protein